MPPNHFNAPRYCRAWPKLIRQVDDGIEGHGSHLSEQPVADMGPNMAEATIEQAGV